MSEGWDEKRLARWIGATRGAADRAALERALARLDARADVPAWARRLAHPASLALATLLLASCLALAAGTRPAGDSETAALLSAYVGEGAMLALDDTGASPSDSGSLAR